MSTQHQLSDELIGQIAKLLQLAILTGTHVVDNMRMLRVTVGEVGKVVMSEDYKEYFDRSIDKMLKEIEDLRTSETPETNKPLGSTGN